MNPRKRRLSDRTIAAIQAEYSQGEMPFHPIAENKHWRDNRMYFRGHINQYYQQCLINIHGEQEDMSINFWDWAVEYFKHDDIKVVWCNVYRCHALHFITDEAKIEFLLRHGKAEPFNLFNGLKLPIIRRVIPSLIATDILAVQPMTKPSSLIFSSRAGFGMKLQKDDNDVS